MRATLHPSFPGLRRLLRRPAVAAAAVAAVLATASAAAAHDRLPIFRTEQVTAVGFTTADLVSLPDLRAFGDLEVSGDVDVRSVPDARTAAAETGLDVPEVISLPRGVSAEPVHQVVGEVRATFTFSAERAAAGLAPGGTPTPEPPAGLDGTQVRLAAGPGVVTTWLGGSGAPALVVARAVAPTASSQGLPFEVVRDHLLALAGLPDDVAAELRTYTGDGSTLPLPVPAEHVTTTTADVGGIPATVLATRDGALAAVVWVDGGVVSAVAGALTPDEVLSVARDLR